MRSWGTYQRETTKSSTYGFGELPLLDVQLLLQTVGGVLSHDEVLVFLVNQLLDLLDATILLAQSVLGLLVSVNDDEVRHETGMGCGKTTNEPAGLLVKSGFEVSNAGFEFGNDTLSSEQSGGFCFLDLDLELFHLNDLDQSTCHGRLCKYS